MADKNFGVKQINLIGSGSGTPTIVSPNNLNLNATTVAISTDLTIGGQIQSNVIVGTAYSFTTKGDTYFLQNLNVSGIVTATDFNSLSDVRYKENINTVSDALSKVTELRGVRFDWKESGLPSYGVIAQELQEVLPELVHGHNPRTVNYNGIIGVLIEAIKELKAEIEELKKA